MAGGVGAGQDIERAAMCLILFAHGAHADYPLVFAANRDEFHGRPTAPAAFWQDAPQLLAGRDLRAGGTWFGVTRDGRWAAVTNFRAPGAERPGGPSRGHLVAEYLRGVDSPEAYAAALVERMDRYSGFNLLLAHADRVLYLGHGSRETRPLDPGVYGLSNHLLDTPWPKVEEGKRALQAVLAAEGGPTAEALLQVLARTDPAPEAELPDTGVGAAWERVLSAPFIISAEYGTRASTALLIDARGVATFVERSFVAGPRPAGDVRHRFRIRREPAR